jgi:phosphatidylglycerol:prolipoprotein diacylglycerol transferase
MLINTINPVLLHLGPFQVRYYGLVYAIGFLVSYFVLRNIAKKGSIKNFNEQKAESLLLYLLIGVVAGARILEFVFYYPSVIFQNPLEIFMVWHGGMSFHGGIIGGILAGWLFCKKNKIMFYKIADIIVIPAAFFLFLGRLANYTNGELVGIKTNVPWCVIFPSYDNLPVKEVISQPGLFMEYCRHPTQLYEAAKNLVIFFTLLFMSSKKKFKDGMLFWTFVMMYGVLRLIINFLRDEERILLGLSMGQILCVIMIVLSIVFLFKIGNNKKGSSKANRKKK